MNLKTPLIVGLSVVAMTLAHAQQFADVKSLDKKPAAPPTDATLKDAKYLDKNLPIEERIDDLMKHLTMEEKAEIIHGASGYSYGKMPRIGMQEFATYDGPQGVRLNGDRTSTNYPSGLAMTATWNPAIIHQLGRAIGLECQDANGRVILGPGVNIMRTPLGARTFEYMGEDPLLSGKMSAGYVKGVQSVGTAACMKHWLLNDQEWARTVIDVYVSERALREIYARPYEIAIKEANPWMIMGGYNIVRGKYATHNLKLNNILYKDCGWDGALVSDWGGWHGDEQSLNGGGTICMPSGKDENRNKSIVKMVEEGKVNKDLFNEAVRRNLRLCFRVGAFNDEATGKANTEEQQTIGRQVAEEAMVLLKNEKNFLPLNPKKIKKVAVIGPNADQYHSMSDGYGLPERGGSGAVRGPYEITPLKAIVDTFGEENVLYAPGFRFEEPKVHSCPNLKPMDPVEAAKQADVVIFVGGTDHYYDKERMGWGVLDNADKPDLLLKGDGKNPQAQVELLNKVSATNPKTVVVLVSGAPVEMESWKNGVPAILQAWYGGQDAGKAIVNILTGEVNPSGKLPCSFGKRLEDWLSHSLGESAYPGVIPTDAEGKKMGEPRQFYSDFIWVGYRHFDRAGIEPSYPFGHGLSYTTFKLAKEKSDKPDTFSIKVTNTGKRAGAEVVQCYVSKPETDTVMPQKELVAFEKVYLKPGETKTVTFTLNDEAYRYWDEKKQGWNISKGDYKVSVGSSSRDLPVTFTLTK